MNVSLYFIYRDCLMKKLFAVVCKWHEILHKKIKVYLDIITSFEDFVCSNVHLSVRKLFRFLMEFISFRSFNKTRLCNRKKDYNSHFKWCYTAKTYILTLQLAPLFFGQNMIYLHSQQQQKIRRKKKTKWNSVQIA